jgi:homoserine kinase
LVKVKIPATSANLGSGFDALGLSLTMYNYLEVEESDGISISSTDAVAIPSGTDNLVYKTIKYLYDVCGRPLPGVKIMQTNNIPMARGLGSSSACIVGGLVAANQMMGSPLSHDELLGFAATLEGHPDNVAPALLGGLVTAVIENGKVYHVKQSIKDDLMFAAFIPDFELKTSNARKVIPQEISHKDAVFNLSRSALMSVSLYSGNYENLRVACDDRLHQQYRLPLIKGARDIFSMSYEFGAYASFISGAGPTIMSIVNTDFFDFEGKANARLRDLRMTGWRLHMLSIDNRGAAVKLD